MRDYHEYEKSYIGESDIATLIFVGCGENGIKATPIYFGEDGRYLAYIVDSKAKIGGHYELKEEFDTWLRIYDDRGLTQVFRAKKIRVYQAGMRGCIIQELGGN